MKVKVIKGVSAQHTEINKGIEAIVRDLIIYGRCVTGNTPAARAFSNRVKVPKKKKWIMFQWDSSAKKHTITLKPGATIKVVSKYSIDISFEEKQFNPKLYKGKLYKESIFKIH